MVPVKARIRLAPDPVHRARHIGDDDGGILAVH